MKVKKMFGTLMTKFIVLALGCGLAEGAWGGDSSVTNKVVSANLFGALTVNAGAATNAFVAVPFGAFGVGDAPIAAADIVQAAALSDGDKMYVWNGAEGSEQKYEVYTVASGAWTVANKVTVAADGSQSMGSESPEAFMVATGAGVFIERKDTSKPLYVYGQVLTNTMATTEFAAGLTLVSAPSTKAMSAIDLNALTWSGVGDVSITTIVPGMTIVNSWDGADFIYYRNAQNKVIRLYHNGGKWGTSVGTWNPGSGTTIPAGTAFWYMKNGSGSTTVTWPGSKE